MWNRENYWVHFVLYFPSSLDAFEADLGCVCGCKYFDVWLWQKNLVKDIWAYRYTQLHLQSCVIIFCLCQSLCLSFMKVIHVTEILFDHHLKAWRNSPGIAVDGCLLTYLGPDFCKKCKDGKPNNIHSAKFNSPFTEETPRFEVKFWFTHTDIHTYIHLDRQTDIHAYKITFTVYCIAPPPSPSSWELFRYTKRIICEQHMSIT